MYGQRTDHDIPGLDDFWIEMSNYRIYGNSFPGCPFTSTGMTRDEVSGHFANDLKKLDTDFNESSKSRTKKSVQTFIQPVNKIAPTFIMPKQS